MAERLTTADISHLQVIVVRQPHGALLAIELQDLATGAVLLRVDPPVSQWLAAQLMTATTRVLRLTAPSLPGDHPAGLSDDNGMASGPGPAFTNREPGQVWERGTWRSHTDVDDDQT